MHGAFYFSSFEKGAPCTAKTSRAIAFLWQTLAVAALVVGANYIRWRWMASLNYDALWYAVPLVIAETLAYCGTILFTLNLWQVRDVKRRPPPRDIRQCLDPDDTTAPRPVKVDLFIATYSEDTELVRLSIQDAKRVTYPFPWIIAFTFWMTASAPRCAASPNKKV